MSQWWSWLLAGIGVTGLWLAGCHHAGGWVVGLFAQVLWVIYGWVTKQYGFIASAGVYGTVYWYNYVKWRHETIEYRNADAVTDSYDEWVGREWQYDDGHT